MSRATRAIDRLFAQIDAMPHSPEERGLIDEAVVLADDARDDERAFAARMRLIASANNLGDTETSLIAFAWCLGMHDRNPKRFPVDETVGGVRLLWSYKWMVPSLAKSPAFSRAQVLESLADMQRRYDTARIGRSGVLTAGYKASVALGDEAKAESYRVSLQATPRDEYSDCEACDSSLTVRHLARTGRDAEAITALEAMLDDDQSCSEEPELAIAGTLVSYLRSGDAERAKFLHLRGYRLARGNPDNLGMIADHVRFCAMSGNIDRGLTLVERHFGWLTWDALGVMQTFSALLAFAVLLEGADAAGQGERVVNVAATAELSALLGSPSAGRTVTELAAVCWAAAERIGAEFDSRNGNDAFSRRVATARRTAGERHEALFGDDESLTTPTLATEAFATPPQPQTPVEWIGLARERWTAEDAAGAREALAASVENASDAEKARALLMLARVENEAGESGAASAALEERWRLLVALGRSEEVRLERELGDTWIEAGESRDDQAVVAAFDALESDDRQALGMLSAFAAIALGGIRDIARAEIAATDAVAAFDLAGDEQGTGRALLLQGYSRLILENPTGALESVTAALALPADRINRLEGHSLLADVQSILGNEEEALASVTIALQLALQLEARQSIVRAAMTSARILDSLGRRGEGLARTRLALHHSQLGELGHLPELQSTRAEQLIALERPDEALEILVELYETRVSLGLTDGQLGHILYTTGRALKETGNDLAAAGAWRDAAARFAAIGHEDDIGRAAASEIQAAELLVDNGEYAAARDLASSARDRLATIEIEQGNDILAAALLLLGHAECHLGEKRGLTSIQRGQELLVAIGEPWPIARGIRTLALGHRALGNIDASVALSLQAADQFAAADDIDAAVLGERFASMILAENGRPAEAVAPLMAARGRLNPGHPGFSQITFELAAALEKLGRHDEANELRASVEEV